MDRKSADAATEQWTRSYYYDDKGSDKLSKTSLGRGNNAAARYEHDAVPEPFYFRVGLVPSLELQFATRTQ